MSYDIALAWVGIASLYYGLGFHGYMPPKLAYSQGGQALQKALDLDDVLPEAHALVGSLRAIEYDWKGAEREFRRAMELNPQSVDILESYDYFYLVPMGRLDEAIAGMRKALERDPLSPLLQFRLGLWYLYARQSDRAMEQFRDALDLDPNYYAAHAAIGKLQANSGKPDEAIRSAETIVKLTAADKKDHWSLARKLFLATQPPSAFGTSSLRH